MASQTPSKDDDVMADSLRERIARALYDVRPVGRVTLGGMEKLSFGEAQAYKSAELYELADAVLAALPEIDRLKVVNEALVSALEDIIPRFERCCAHTGTSREFIVQATAEHRNALALASAGL